MTEGDYSYILWALQIAPFSMDLQERKSRIMRKTYAAMFMILVIFGIPAILAYFVGAWLDTTYSIRPMGSVAAIVVAAIVSWTILIRIYLKLSREIRKIEKEEAELEEAENDTHIT